MSVPAARERPRRTPLALLQRAVLSALMTVTVAIVERRLRAALKQRSP